MTHERWNQIEKNNILLISGKWRRVIRTSEMCKIQILTFRKVNSYLSLNPNTSYCYSDIAHKINAIIKIKK